jgi:predicted acylesterase/phospholipase RssA
MFSNIIFSGGALKGWAYIGTIKALRELVKKDLIKRRIKLLFLMIVLKNECF